MFSLLKHDPSSIGKFLYPEIKWRTGNNKILLTIDDSPNKTITPLILKILSEAKVEALFFCIGRNIRQTGSLVNEIIAENHTLGNHSFNHINLRKLKDEDLVKELDECSDLLSNAAGKPIKYFRPPYGKFNSSVVSAAKAKGMSTVLWSLLTYDYKNDINLVKFAYRYLKNNSIVVLHDNTKNSSIIENSLYKLFEEVEKNNFKFGSPVECLK